MYVCMNAWNGTYAHVSLNITFNKKTKMELNKHTYLLS